MSSLSSAWTNSASPSTSIDAQTFLDIANYKISHIPAIPQLTVATNTNTIFTDAKIRFILKNFSYVTTNDGYLDVENWANTEPGTIYHDPNAINVFFGTKSYTTLITTPNGTFVSATHTGGSIGSPRFSTGTGTLNAIHFNPEFHYTVTPTCTYNCLYDNVNKYGETFVHEVCHSLGLNHTMGVATTYSDCCDVEESSFIAPLFGCTNYVAANDYFSERYPCSGPVSPIAPTHSCYIIYGSGGCDVAGTSDNVMSRNGSCNRYLSPQQAAVLHFNLTTILKSFLTPNSFSTVTEVNTAFDYNVTSDEIWQNGDRYIKGNITVKAGKTLTIKCGVAMTNGAKIIVEKTALLVVDGGTITNISGRTWDGIYVWGDPLQSQAVSSGMPVYQGMAKFINGAVISHAKVGVRNYRDPFWEYGGIILGGNSSFLNNYIDAEFKGSNSSAPTAVSASKFSSCHFKTTEDIGDNLEPFAHVNLYKSVGVCF